MIVCICRVVTERAVKSSIENGASTLREVENACGAGSGCGACRFAIAQMVTECHGDCPDCPSSGFDVMSPLLAKSGEAA